MIYKAYLLQSCSDCAQSRLNVFTWLRRTSLSANVSYTRTDKACTYATSLTHSKFMILRLSSILESKRNTGTGQKNVDGQGIEPWASRRLQMSMQSDCHEFISFEAWKAFPKDNLRALPLSYAPLVMVELLSTEYVLTNSLRNCRNTFHVLELARLWFSDILQI